MPNTSMHIAFYCMSQSDKRFKHLFGLGTIRMMPDADGLAAGGAGSARRGAGAGSASRGATLALAREKHKGARNKLVQAL